MTPHTTKTMDELSHLTLQDLRLLLLIRQGVDNRPELVKASGFNERTVFRRVDMFRGFPRYADGKLMDARTSLVVSRKHPHQQGMQFALSPEGEMLLSEVKGLLTSKANARPANL